MSPSPLSLRSARLGDHAALALLWRSVDELHARARPDFFTMPDVGFARADLDRLLRARSAALIVAELEGQVVGCAHLQLYDTPRSPGMRARKRVHVERLVVDERARRRGVGRRLMDEAARWGAARGAAQLVLTVWSGNDAAARFYEALGYQQLSQVLGRELPGA